MSRGIFLVWVAAIILLIVAGLFYFPAIKSKVAKVVAPQPATPNAPQALTQEIEGLNLGNLDSEFQAIDADLNKL